MYCGLLISYVARLRYCLVYKKLHHRVRQEVRHGILKDREGKAHDEGPFMQACVRGGANILHIRRPRRSATTVI